MLEPTLPRRPAPCGPPGRWRAVRAARAGQGPSSDARQRAVREVEAEVHEAPLPGLVRIDRADHRMPAARKCAVACRFGLMSQQPIWPQARHCRRWTQVPPDSTQAGRRGAAGRPGGGLEVLAGRCHGLVPSCPRRADPTFRDVATSTLPPTVELSWSQGARRALDRPAQIGELERETEFNPRHSACEAPEARERCGVSAEG